MEYVHLAFLLYFNLLRLGLFIQVVAVADPRQFARTKLQQQHKIEDKNAFEGEHESKVFKIIYILP